MKFDALKRARNTWKYDQILENGIKVMRNESNDSYRGLIGHLKFQYHHSRCL